MKPRITVITLGVDDLEESLKFYRDGLGLTTQGIIGAEFNTHAFLCIRPHYLVRILQKTPYWTRKQIT